MSSDFDGHTPAPWRVEEGTTLVWGACQDDAPRISGGFPVAEACTKWESGNWAKRPDYDEADANARLIAAAPDLLAERDRLAEVNAELVEALTGVIDMTVVMVDDEGNAFGVIRPVGDFSAARAALAKARGQA